MQKKAKKSGTTMHKFFKTRGIDLLHTENLRDSSPKEKVS